MSQPCDVNAAVRAATEARDASGEQARDEGTMWERVAEIVDSSGYAPAAQWRDFSKVTKVSVACIWGSLVAFLASMTFVAMRGVDFIGWTFGALAVMWLACMLSEDELKPLREDRARRWEDAAAAARHALYAGCSEEAAVELLVRADREGLAPSAVVAHMARR